jgi:hypothetical protein
VQQCARSGATHDRAPRRGSAARCRSRCWRASPTRSSPCRRAPPRAPRDR